MAKGVSMKMLILLLGIATLIGCGSTGGTPPDGGGTQPKFDCQNPLGGVVKHGESVTLFEQDKVVFGSTCKSEVRQCNNGVLSGSFVYGSCEVLPEAEPASHEQPMQISDEGLKMGGIKELGDKWIVGKSSRQFSPKPPARPICQTEPLVGSECRRGMPVCQTADDMWEYSCGVKKSYKVFGWIYEKNGLDYSKMAENVKVDILWFTQCMQGYCEPSAGPVYTDKWGYFEFITGSLLDTLRLDGLPKYYMFCNKGKPIAGGGQYITNSANKPIGPFKQLLNKPGVCDQNFLMKMFAEDEAPKNTNDIHGEHPLKLK